MRKILEYLPRSWRHELMRRSFRLHYEWPEPFRLKLATSPAEFEAAFRLIHDCHVRSGHGDPDPSGMRVLPHHLLPQTSIVIALWDDQVIGTSTLIRDNPMGLPMEKAFDLSRARVKGRRIGEVTCLAVAPEYRKGLDRVFLPLLKFTYHYARECFGIHRIVAGVHSSTVEMYEAILGIDPIAGLPRPMGLLKSGAAVALSVDLDRYPQRLSQLYGNHASGTDLSRYLQSKPNPSQFWLPEREYYHASDLAISPQVMEDLFFGKAKIQERLSEQDLLVLAKQYPHPNYLRILDFKGEEPRKEVRIDARFPARLNLQRSHSEVWDVSRTGLRLVTHEKLQVGSRVDLRVSLNRSVQAYVEAQVRWSSGQSNLYGLKIETVNSAWEQMMRSLEGRFLRLASDSTASSSQASILA